MSANLSDDDRDEDGFVPPRSGSFRIIEARLPVAGVDFPRTRAQLEEMFPSDAACHAYLERLRWPRGFVCLSCEAKGEPWRSGTGLLACGSCRSLVAVTHGSIFHGAAIPLRRWFRAIWEVTEREAGTSVAAIQRVLELREITTAQRCLDALRAAMTLPTRRKLRGSVEVAKALVEVSHRGVLGRPSTQRVQLILAVERGVGDIGQVRARYLRRVDSPEAFDFVRENVTVGSEIVTLACPSYAMLAHAGYNHRTAIKTPPGGPPSSMPQVEQVAALLRLWLWSAPDVTTQSLQGCAHEFTFRFNRRWYPRGLLFYRLMILSALFETADDEMLGIAACG
jgi:hypothetical protein